MREFKKRRGSREQLLRLALQSAGVLALAGITFGAGHAAWGMYQKLSEASTASGEAQTQLASLQAQQIQVTAQVTELSSQEGVEAQLRERYGVAEPGEGEIDIIDMATATESVSAAPAPWWQAAWHALFGWM